MGLFCLAWICCFGFLMTLLALSMQYKHLLSVLLSLEAMMMNLFILLLVFSSSVCFSGESCMILIALGACEASLGLSILVSMIRVCGNDYVSSFSNQKC